jgi:hypothetical protein
MNKIDDILERLKGQQPEIDDPDALTDRIMDSLPDLEPSEEPQRSARVVSMRRRWMAAAASILLIIGMGTVLMKETGVSSQEPVASRDTHINAQPLPSHLPTVHKAIVRPPIVRKAIVRSPTACKTIPCPGR